jgi:hypothetical protein
MIIYQAGTREYKGNLHMHTTGSDGNKSPMEAVLAYEVAGSDFLAITDHRSVTLLREYQGKTLLLSGIEMDEEPSLREVIHLLGIGGNPGLMGRYQAGMKSQEAIDLVNLSGGICFLAHPHWSLNRPETLKGLRGLAGMEIFNSASRQPYNPDRADSTHMLDLLASDGLLYPTIAADDTHYYGLEFARSFILAQADRLSEKDVMDALRAGRFYASQGPRFTSVSVDDGVVHVVCSPVSNILFHSNLAWNRGRAVSGDGLTEAAYRLDLARGESFVRVILIDSDGRRAWMRPFAVRPEAG